jgi:hypothetical protein
MLIHRLIARLLLPVQLGIVDGEGGSGNPSSQSGTQESGTSDGQSPSGSDSGSGPAGEEGAQGEGTPAGAEGGEEGPEETVIKIGDEELPPAEEAAPWIKDLRRRFREQERELAGYRRGTSAAPAAQGLPPAPGPKPKIGDAQIDYDPEKLEAALDKWHEASNKYNDAKRKVSEQQAQEQRAWEQTVASYQEAGAKLGFSDYEDCEAAATAALSETQAAIIVQGCESAEKAALVMYSLGRNMKLLQDLAKLQDPVKFAFAVADIQRKLVMIKRKPTTKPESTIPASAVGAGAAMQGEDKKLNELREKAVKSGDMTELMNYRRQQREKQSARK